MCDIGSTSGEGEVGEGGGPTPEMRDFAKKNAPQQKHGEGATWG